MQKRDFSICFVIVLKVILHIRISVVTAENILRQSIHETPLFAMGGFELVFLPFRLADSYNPQELKFFLYSFSYKIEPVKHF